MIFWWFFLAGGKKIDLEGKGREVDLQGGTACGFLREITVAWVCFVP